MRNCRRKGTVGRSAGIAGLCVLALCPAGAFAATANTRIKRVFYEAGPAEVNQVTISLSGENYLVPTRGYGHRPARLCGGGGHGDLSRSRDHRHDRERRRWCRQHHERNFDALDTIGRRRPRLAPGRLRERHAAWEQGSRHPCRWRRRRLHRRPRRQGRRRVLWDGNDTVMGDIADSIAADCETSIAVAFPRLGRPGRPLAPLPRPKPCSGRRDTHAGSRRLHEGQAGQPGNDRLSGTALGDNLFGLQGDDFLKGLQGDDCLFGGVGSDRLAGIAGRRPAARGRQRPRRRRPRPSRRKQRQRPARRTARSRPAPGARERPADRRRWTQPLLAGSGNDRLNGLNGSVDRLNCGSGHDRARADRLDRVRGCEQVRRGASRSRR